MSRSLSQELLSGASFAGSRLCVPGITARLSVLASPCTEAPELKAEEESFPVAPGAERAPLPATLRQLASRVALAGNGPAFRHEGQVSSGLPISHVPLVVVRKVAAGEVLPNPAVQGTWRIKPRQSPDLER
jgi:hypothetical protein